ncbi:HCP-like protein [Hyphopichia burtonii NRRL Y-1933]|uniref:HCP-like protein n=1 Tax=Hyphopichia burtonii NRRL Y-1933 TaxID=984485 RepID=A0A1E4RNH5_9ASCO|nr:HCP-like protein [Hyphopichia burtonii NRRL Y-1933]ODV68786.1 HCP-like protein [Hyphopichia burtonii NRRL Y-1933]
MYRLQSILNFLLFFIGSLLESVIASTNSSQQLYEQAITIIDTLPPPDTYLQSIFNDDNIDNYLYIPQYNVEKQNYESYDPNYAQFQENFIGFNSIMQYFGFGLPPNDTSINELKVTPFQEQVLPLLERAAEENHVDSLVKLADVYMFGNYSTPTNYHRALSLYHRAVSIEANGHAYFMLGFIYSTGLFGEIPIDKKKSDLYYQFGAENNDVNSILVLANKFLNGFGRVSDCTMARYYYSRLSHLGMKYLNENNIVLDDHDVLYNIRLVDFKGGLYGPKLSESESTVFKRSFASYKHSFTENNLDIHEHEYVDYFFNSLEYYYGDYFIEKNQTKAFEVAQECVNLAKHRYGRSGYMHVNDIDRFFISNCQVLYAKMLFYGHGVKQNYDEAYKWFSVAAKIGIQPTEAYNYLGQIHQMAPLTGNAESLQALSFYEKALKLKSARGALNIAKAGIRQSDGNILNSKDADKIHTLIKDAAYNGNAEALYFWINFLDSGVSEHFGFTASCEVEVTFHRRFGERLEKFFYPHLKYAFEEVKYGNFKNALLGYAMAAEQGVENAQVSAAYLLFQLEPFIPIQDKKNFDKDRVNMAIKYLERASAQHNLDSTVLLGDIYFYGVKSANISVDYNKAFAYYNTAAKDSSSHGCFNLGYMYEYGLGPVNNSVDYFMAKRYYDNSLQLKRVSAESKSDLLMPKVNTVPINLALLRLRLKFLFNKKEYSRQKSNNDNNGWLSAFRKLGANSKEIESRNLDATEKAKRDNAKAQAHHEGSSYFVDEEYDTGDYLVLFFTSMFFLVFLIQNIYRHVRRLGQRRNNDQPENQNQPDRNENQNGNGFHFEFHFVAL